MKEQYDNAQNEIQSLQRSIRNMRSECNDNGGSSQNDDNSAPSTPRRHGRKKPDVANAGFKDKSYPTPDKDLIKKFKYDNQILLKRLSEYKKAEKGAVQIVRDYDEMKVKYFQVLQENQQQKLNA